MTEPIEIKTVVVGPLRQLTGPHMQAAQILQADPNFTMIERLTLVACLHARQHDREVRKSFQQQAALDQKDVCDYGAELRDILNSSWRPDILLFRFMSGQSFPTQRDFYITEKCDIRRQELTERRNRDFREHQARIDEVEMQFRLQVAKDSPHAKRAFNTIAISRVTENHFPEEEIRAIRHIPNPLERVFI